MIIIPEFILIILIGVSFFIGVGIGFFLKKKNSPYNNKRYKFKKYSWAIIGFFWFVLLVITSSIYEKNIILCSAVSLISLVVGLNLSYNMMKLIMQKSVQTEYDLWAIRIKAIIFACSGIFIAIFASLIFYNVDYSMYTPMVGPTQLTIYFWSIGLGMIIFAAYMEFVFERKAGILVFSGRQRF